MSYARRHFQAVQAAAAQSEAAPESQSAYQALLKRLMADKVLLKSVNSLADKLTIKAEALPAYQSWIDGVIAAGRADPGDKIAAELIVWQIDCGQLDAAMPLAKVLVAHPIESGDDYRRTLPEIIIEQMAEQIDQGAAIAPENLATLIEWATARGENGLHRLDLADPIRAKLLKVAGAAAEDAGDLETALAHYRAAHGYNERAGVKKRIDALEKQQKEAEKQQREAEKQ